MKKITLRRILALVLLCMLPVLLAAQQDAQFKTLVFKHVTIIDATGAAAQSNMTVVITGNRIVKIGKTSRVKVPNDAQVIDATGKFLIPGLWDMHVHASGLFRNLYLANGVTGVREMGGIPLDRLTAWRKGLADGTFLGPRVFAAGRILDGAPPVWPQLALPVTNEIQARAAVVSLKQGGVDFIKVYSLLSRDAYLAIVDESKRQGLTFAGHVPNVISVVEASNAGQKSIEHTNKIQLACSSLEQANIDEFSALVNTSEARARHLTRDWLRIKKIVETYDAKRAAKLFDLLARNGTRVTPTLVVLDSMAKYSGNADYERDPRWKYMPGPLARAFWGTRGNNWSVSELAIAEQRFYGVLEIVKAMRRARVQILAGSDSPAERFVFPAFSLHEELELLVKAGLTPMEALQTSTLNPARFLGMEKDLGTVQQGKLADLVLLDANPLSDIRNTQKIQAVVVNGVFLDRKALDKLLAEAETAARG